MCVCVCAAVMAILTQTTWHAFKKSWQLMEWLKQTWPTSSEISFKTQEGTFSIQRWISVGASTCKKAPEQSLCSYWHMFVGLCLVNCSSMVTQTWGAGVQYEMKNCLWKSSYEFIFYWVAVYDAMEFRLLIFFIKNILTCIFWGLAFLYACTVV